MKERLEKIHSRGYWRVVIRPTKYIEERIQTLSDCWEIVNNCYVSLRGWNYPHISRKPDERVSGTKWISSGADLSRLSADLGNIEYWRFYQSGQFVHHFSMREDYELQGQPTSIWSDEPIATKFLSIVSTIYTVTEIFLFLSRLTSKGLYSEGAEIIIELRGTESRQLVFVDQPYRYLGGDYICQIPEIIFNKLLNEEELLLENTDIAMKCVTHIFERFNWHNIPIEILQEDQEKLLKKNR